MLCPGTSCPSPNSKVLSAHNREDTVHSAGEHLVRVLFSPFIPWDDTTSVCRETCFPDVWDISTCILEIRNPILKKKEKPN